MMNEMLSSDMTFAGRIMLAPATKQPPNSTLLYINFGWGTGTNQKYPSWIPALAPAISKEHYDTLFANIKDYLDANSLTQAIPIIGAVVPVLGCGCCAYAHVRSNDITKSLNELVSTAGWVRGTEIAFNLVPIFQLQGSTPDEVAYDQFGTPVKGFAGGGNTGVIETNAWPPLGYNIIVKVPNPNLKTMWPKSGAGFFADPNQIGVLTVPVVVTGAAVQPNPNVMARDTSARYPPVPPAAALLKDPQDDLLDKLAKMKKLLDMGALSQEEFDSKKAKLLARV